MFSQYFIDKPRFAGVISIVMILLGLLAICCFACFTVSADYAAADCRFHDLSGR